MFKDTILPLFAAGLLLAGCGAQPTVSETTAPIIPSSTATIEEEPTTDIIPSATPEQSTTDAADPTMTIPAVIFDDLHGATNQPSLTPGRGSASGLLDHDLPDVGDIPADVTSWQHYVIRMINLTIPVPPDWLVVEWPIDDQGTLSFFYSASIYPEAYADLEKYGYQHPSIEITLYRQPISGDLSDWLSHYGTSEPFGSAACNDSVNWCEVAGIEAKTVGDSTALTFTSDAMGISIVNTIFVVDDVVAAISRTHSDTIPFDPVYDLMLDHLEMIE